MARKYGEEKHTVKKRTVRIWKSRYKEVSNSTVSLRGDHETKSDRRNVVMLVRETT